MTTVTETITSGYYLSGIVSRDFETVSGQQLADGLILLNDILDEPSINANMIPYVTHTEFNTVPDQEIYDIPNLVELDTLTFNIDNVRYPMRRDTQYRHFGHGRTDDVASLPYHYYFERQLGIGRIFLYFVPDQAYQMNLIGKFKLSQVDFNDDLSLSFDRFYIRYLKYYLARSICEFFDVQLSAQTQSKLNDLDRQINKFAGTDLSIRKWSMIGKKSSFDYAQANLGRGYEP